ncbi:MAG: hypothetical protein ACPIOQ_29970, partial [Promethearchaeia archaeon]
AASPLFSAAAGKPWSPWQLPHQLYQQLTSPSALLPPPCRFYYWPCHDQPQLWHFLFLVLPMPLLQLPCRAPCALREG